MPSKMAMVNFAKCQPEKCRDGICAAALACTKKILIQEKLGEAPMTNPAACRACADCVRACPAKAISIFTQ